MENPFIRWTHGRLPRFLIMLYQHKHCQRALIGTETGQNKRSFSAPKFLKAVNRLIEVLSCRYVLFSRIRKDESRWDCCVGQEAKDNGAIGNSTEHSGAATNYREDEGATGTDEGALGFRYYSQTLKPNGVDLGRFQTHLVLVTP